ncbi:MAG: murein biosynthesis integral membrane protein MurJ [Patescibacteria group bacterium]|nr:murein biosynthesis integral membrane protein MurJ [Patescibacteria group bacterium]
MNIFRSSPTHFSITRATLIIAFFSLLSRVLGLFRDRIFAASFGAGQTLDVYYAAFRIPDFLFNLLILGTLSAAFIPVFTSYRVKDEPTAWRIANSIFNLTLLVMGALSLVLVAAAPLVTRLIVPGFSGDALNATIKLTRIMLLSPFFFSLSSVFSSILNSYKRFALVAALPVVYNLSIIFGVLFLYPTLGLPGLAWGVVLGAFLHMLLQLPSLFSTGFRWRPILELQLSGVKRIAKLFLPRVLTMDFSPLIASAVGSLLPAGSIAVYNLANNLQSVPLGVFAVSFATAAFPVLSEAAAKQEHITFKKVFNETLAQILYLMIPLSALMLVLRAQIVRLILGAGRFSWEDTVWTISALGFFVLSLFAQGLIPLLTRAFYSLHNTTVPVITGFLSAVVNIWAAVYFTSTLHLNVAGLALAFSVASLVNFLLLFVWLEIKFGNLISAGLILNIEKIVVGTLSMGVVAYATLYAVAPFLNTRTGVGLGLQTLAALVAGGLTYWLVGFALNLTESRHILAASKSWLVKIRNAFVRSPEL